MESIDVFVWLSDEEGTRLPLAVQALKSRLKVPVAQWFLCGPRSERLDRLAYDLGLKAVVWSPSHPSWTTSAVTNGTAPVVIFWSTDAVLVADWSPLQGKQAKIWKDCPAAVLKRTDLTGMAQSWDGLTRLSTLERMELPENQIKVLPLNAFEKAARTSNWLLGPKVVILETSGTRR